ncbi:hypothetical protein BGAL_0224g00110 [Botrytis galanthina]|uniref:Uncharacterized protein n=1 Tax=Botrytis galanthina TaxID=278940 RepID=A0A4S8R3Y2_9HELO|nr:hypothetical protein BGAL_0224g00110 [Botrytis galanthina]
MYHPAGEQTLCRIFPVHATGDEDEDINQGYISAEKMSRELGNWVIKQQAASNTSDGYEEGWGGVYVPCSNEKSAGVSSAAW